MNTRLRSVAYPSGQHLDVPKYRSILAVDLEGSTTRTNPVKGELRRIMYDLLERSLDAVSITAGQLEPLTDRGDGVLALIRPHDDVPKTVVLGRLIPLLTALLNEQNETADPALQMRLRAVVHAGEVHDDNWGFYGEAIDVAIRLLDSPVVKAELRGAASPLVLVVSEEIYFGVVAHGYVESRKYRPLVRVRVARRQHRGWVCLPTPGSLPALPSPEQGRSSRLLRSA
jgi:class 3 adenylate cyclase